LFIPPPSFPPTVEFTSLYDGALVDGSGLVPVRVKASDKDGTISQVELWINGRLSSSSTEEKLALDIGYGVDTLVLEARAYDNAGAESISKITVVQINQPKIEAENCDVAHGKVLSGSSASGGYYVRLDSSSSLNCPVTGTAGIYSLAFPVKAAEKAA